MTGIEWVREAGMLLSPIGITNTHSVGVVRDTLVALEVEELAADREVWALSVVGKTWDGIRNDVNGFHVRPGRARAALGRRGARWPARPTGGGPHPGRPAAAPAGRRLDHRARGDRGLTAAHAVPPARSTRLLRRGPHGRGASNSSGDLFLAFPTGNRGMPPCHYGDAPPPTSQVRMLSNSDLNALFDAVIEATEEAIVNALVAAQTLTEINGVTAHALPHDLLREARSAPVKPRS